MGLNWFVSWKLHNSYTCSLQLCKYNLKWNISWHGQTSIKELKNWEKRYRVYFYKINSDTA